MSLFGSIEDKHGVNDPGYTPTVDEPIQLADDKGPIGALEIVGSVLVPIAGVVFAIMRFADNEVGPGIACLLMSMIGWFCWAIAILVLA